MRMTPGASLTHLLAHIVRYSAAHAARLPCIRESPRATAEKGKNESLETKFLYPLETYGLAGHSVHQREVHV